MNSKYELKVWDSAEAVCTAACDLMVSIAVQAIKERGRFSIVLSGGHTPEKMFEQLASASYRDQIDWSRTFVFWGDERCVPADDKRNNSFVAKSLLLDKVNIPKENIYPIPVDVSPTEGAEKYEQTIRDFFGTETPVFDLVFLGLGENGHTASLFPGTPVLHEQKRIVSDVYVAELDMYRITMTAPLINQAREIVFLVTGVAKADVVKIILQGQYQPDTYPAQLIAANGGHLQWFVDIPAANEIVPHSF